MASLSLAPPVELESVANHSPSRHARKHSRHPTAAAPLPSFNFNPGSPSDEGNHSDGDKKADGLATGTNSHMRRPSRPTPLPNFTFNPGADIPVERTPSPTHPILEEMALNQQRVSKSAKAAPLPAFTFNPGATAGANSPTKAESDGEGHRTTGHKRGGSEFVGGKAEGAQLVMTSPMKHEPKPSGPPISASGFRGHNHRRSQAISVSDIDTSDLIKQHALAKARNPSNPSTPQEGSFSFPRASPGQRHVQSASRSPPSSPRRGGGSIGSISAYRPRVVDFSEKVDVIPRPLSMISSETERSNSTMRGHSLSNSINSIASPTYSMTPEASAPIVSPLVSPTVESILGRRPSTADASLLLSHLDTSNYDALLSMPKRPLSASGSPMISANGSPPKKKHFWSTPTDDTTPTPTPKHEKQNPFKSEDVAQQLATEANLIRPKTAPERPSSHKRRKYHTWTAGIFSKKSKRGTKKSRRSPTPPTLLRRDSDLVNDIFDADDTVVLRENSPAGTSKQPLVTQQLCVPPTQVSPADSASPMLDLDAALDPFTEDRRHSDDHSRTATAKIAKLHSSERRGVTDAFGVTHRRTESAPALSPVNRSTLFGMRQHGSNASLTEDVFDEQEEDQFLAHEEQAKLHSACNSKEALQQPPASAHENGLGLSNISSHADAVVIVDPENEADTDDVRSSKSTIEAPVLTVDDLPKRPATSPMPFAYPDTQLHYASSTEGRTTSASLISSPDAEHVSFDIQTRPRRYGEPTTDFLRPSTDDLPSLSDSASSNAVARGSYSGNARPSLDQRSNSMFVPGSERLHEGWKRSSLASLNRLIPGSSHGSKSRLDGLPSDGDEKHKKKNHRISKLLRFWRPREMEEKENTHTYLVKPDA